MNNTLKFTQGATPSFNKDLTGLSADKPQIEANASTSLNPDNYRKLGFGSDVNKR